MRQKLTAISVSSNGKSKTVFAMCNYDHNDKVVVSKKWLDKLAHQCGVKYGGTYTCG